MKRKPLLMVFALILGAALFFPLQSAFAEKPIVIGCPLSTAFVYGWDAQRAITLAVEEINGKGGVNVGGEKTPFKVEVIDTRDLEPGVPVSEALLVVEKLILEKNADFIMGGPVRSEAALAAMDLLSKYKEVSILTTGVLTPKYHARVAANYDKYKYCFRITGEAKWMVGGEIIPCLLEIGKEYGLNRLFIMIQDVAHARAGGGIIAKVMAKKGWHVIGQPEVYPTGSSDFSMGLLKARREKADVILIWMDMPQTSILLKQWYDMKIAALPFGSIIAAAEQPGFWKATEGKGEYCLANVVNAGNAPSNATPWTMKFVEAYKKRWGLEPEGYGTSSSYMAPYVLKEAIERAGSLDSEKVVAALEKTDMVGVYGRIRFDPKSHQVIPSLDPEKGAVGTIFQWQAGRRVVVFPKSIAMGKIKLPPWMRK
ncbi:MAG: ABC transporter substrate-binding protein [Deltaproteobacteria bacterium]|nr:ABC transporter substrate-binding protein [Deltaproteobacteria bacterium]MBW1977933.1 ABC transporter substrate-binding protein [Deltaproteobacteria bacterium]MBW2045980.1 ABC transporter substrate-binding protein [Deltaproteobacteria bacterium]MBW2299549.1 ABC transporter substrate-binding protein [Deltaproteobacteria bacterium]RLB32886.1 MAG: ABC transporter substrate-binding protein [Deltaproteobacteria bacterium]